MARSYCSQSGTTVLSQASVLKPALQSAARTDNSAGLLELCARLVRRYPQMRVEARLLHKASHFEAVTSTTVVWA